MEQLEAESTPHRRTTFLSIADVLSEIESQYLEATRRVVHDVRTRGVGPREEIFVRHVERLAEELARSLSRLVEEGPRDVLATHTQYTPDALSLTSPSESRSARRRGARTGSSALETPADATPGLAPEPPRTIEDIGLALLEIDARVQAVCDLIASRAPGEDVRAQLDAVSRLVREHGKAILRTSQTVDDL